MKYCLSCGNRLNGDDLFCDQCGTRQPELAAKPEELPQPPIMPEKQPEQPVVPRQEIPKIKENLTASAAAKPVRESEPVPAPAEEAVVICENCGAAIPESLPNCPECGSQIVKPEIKPPLYSDEPGQQTADAVSQSPVFEPRQQAADAVSQGLASLGSVIGKAAQAASSGYDKLQTAAKETAEKVQKNAELSRQPAQPARPVPAGPQSDLNSSIREDEEFSRKKWNSFLQQYASEDEIWSWVQEGEKKQVFYTEEPSEMTEDDYLEKLKERLSENGVPMNIEKRSFLWDQNEEWKSEVVLAPVTEKINARTCILQFRHVGKFTFVQERMFGKPPKLPAVDKKRDPLVLKNWIAVSIGVMIAGLLGLVASRGNFFFVLVALGGFALAGYTFLQTLSVSKHNAMVNEQIRKWNFAYKCWKQILLDEAYENMSYGDTDRIYTAAWETIVQLNKELFKEKEVVSQSSELDYYALEKLIDSRKEDYK